MAESIQCGNCDAVLLDADPFCGGAILVVASTAIWWVHLRNH